MLPFIACLALLQPEPLQRDDYGVPHIRTQFNEELFYYDGYAVAQDRLWQMENSRRVARGRMAEVFGPSFAASDREVLAQAYTDDELEQQYQALSERAKMMVDNYVKGVNAYIADAQKNNTLPTGYKDNGFAPAPWTRLDTVAVTIRLFQQFGKGGAGEIRNMALLGYLQSQKNLKDRVYDVLEDLAWQNDKTATCTVADKDDPHALGHVNFPIPTRAITEKHIASLPKISLLELLPAVRLAERVESSKVAEKVGVPFKWGSYAVAISAERSATGYPILLSGPQMGFRTPSIIHEISLTGGDYSVVGMDVPGVPGVAIGYDGFLAWGLTSGVADTDDIFYNSYTDSGYKYGADTKSFESVSFPLPIKGQETKSSVVQRRTIWGPVILDSKSTKIVFSRHSASRMKEMQSFESIALMDKAWANDEAHKALERATVNFNCIFAMTDGHIGYRYTGLIPIRNPNFDPRFPTPGDPANKWQGFVPFESMPETYDPKPGLIANWNNKPVSWWTNADTPVWGRIFRNSELLAALSAPKLNVSDVEKAAWTIARKDETWPYFKPFVDQALQGSSSKLRGFDGWMTDGSMQAQLYRYFFDDLRGQLFLSTTGNFVTADNFNLVMQPSVMLQALEGKTRIDYLHGRKAVDVVRAALDSAEKRLAASGASDRYAAPGISVPGQPPIPYSNRGSYIQIVELLKDGPQGRNIVTPGVSEVGPHSLDQVPLARAWLYKPMRRRS